MSGCDSRAFPGGSIRYENHRLPFFCGIPEKPLTPAGTADARWFTAVNSRTDRVPGRQKRRPPPRPAADDTSRHARIHSARPDCPRSAHSPEKHCIFFNAAGTHQRPAGTACSAKLSADSRRRMENGRFIQSAAAAVPHTAQPPRRCRQLSNSAVHEGCTRRATRPAAARAGSASA